MGEFEFAPVGVCPHGLPRDEYCYKCTYVEQPSTQLLEARTISLIIQVEAEPHWTEQELNAEVAAYFTRYLDDGKGYQPETWYIRGCHVEQRD